MHAEIKDGNILKVTDFTMKKSVFDQLADAKTSFPLKTDIRKLKFVGAVLITPNFVVLASENRLYKMRMDDYAEVFATSSETLRLKYNELYSSSQQIFLG